MSDYLSAAVLAGLPGMPATISGVIRRARAEGWIWRKAGGRGRGKVEFRAADLPAETREALARLALARQLAAQPPAAIESNAATGALSGAVIPLPVTAAASAGRVVAGAPVAAPEVLPAPVSSLADWQREVMFARCGVLRLIEQAAPALGSIEAAVAQLQASLADGTASEATRRMIERANARAGGSAHIDRATLFRWRAAREAGGDAALAPASPHPVRLPPWARAALELWRQPAKPSIRYVAERLPTVLAPHGIAAPSYGQVRRFVTQKLGALARNDGRMGPRELKTIAPFVRRDSSKLWPTDVYTADGHTFDAEVAHPANGRPFRPEITGVLDVATRKCVGFSVALDENSFAVLDAQRHAFTTHGICAIWYVDHGSGYDNALQWAKDTGIAARFGFEIKHALPYNSQARGVIERSHKTIWVEAARKLPTFINKCMDAERKNKVFRMTRRDVKKIGTSRLLLPWADLVPFLQAEVDAYNSRPHRGLPKIRDEAGRLRHMSPNEAWAAAVADGFEAHLVSPEEARDLFWPQVVRKVDRGQVRFAGGVYFAPELAEWHGESVRVAYDIHDAGAVLVREMGGRLIAEAKRDGNARDYFAESVLSQASAKRAKARARRLQDKLDAVADELAGPRLLEHAPSPTAAFDWPDLAPAAGMQGNAEAVLRDDSHDAPAPAERCPGPDGQKALGPAGSTAAASRPVFAYFFERYEWLMSNRSEWTEQDAGFVACYVASPEYEASRERYEAMGIAWRPEERFKAAR